MITGRSSDFNRLLWQGTNELVLSTNDYLIPSTFYVYLTPSFLSLLYHEQKYLTMYQISILNFNDRTCIVMISSFINIFCIFLALIQLGLHSLILDFSSVAVDHTLFSSNKYFAFFKMTIFYLTQKFGLQGKNGHNNLLNCLSQNANWGRAETSWCRKSLNVPHFFSEKSFKLQRI